MAYRVSGNDFTRPHKLGNAVEQRDLALRVGKSVFRFGREQINLMPRGFEFWRNDVADLARSHGERNECGRNGNIFERAAHRVLAAYRRNPEIELRFERA